MSDHQEKTRGDPKRPGPGKSPRQAGVAGAGERIIAAARFKATDRILEVGCGDAELTITLARLAGYVTGAAITDDELAVAQDRGLQCGANNLSFQRIDRDRLPYGDNTFAAVVCVGMLHRLGDPSAMVWEMARVLKSPGRLYLADAVGAEDEMMRQAHAKILAARYDTAVTILALSELLTLCDTPPLGIVAQSQWDERLSLEQWMPVEGSSNELSERISRLLVAAAKKKTTDWKIESSGKAINFTHHWIMIISEKTGNI